MHRYIIRFSTKIKLWTLLMWMGPMLALAQPTVSIVLVNMGTTNNADYDAVLRQAADRWEEVLVSGKHANFPRPWVFSGNSFLIDLNSLFFRV